MYTIASQNSGRSSQAKKLNDSAPVTHTAPKTLQAVLKTGMKTQVISIKTFCGRIRPKFYKADVDITG